jgi:carboxyl-terminal processing protease
MLGFRLQEDDLQRKYDLLQKWNKLNTVLNLVDREYVDKISRTEIEENVITLSLRELDPHSVYIPASEMQQANEELDGNFDGIGIIFNVMTDTVVVINTLVGGPSERVGVLSGDRIITVNDSVIAGRKISQDSVVKLLRGASGSKVTIGVQRYGEKKLIPISITRGKIPVKSVDIAYMMSAKTGYIKISKFSRSTFEEFQAAAKKLLEQGMENMVLDLRGNTGGYLDQACEIANQFLPARTLVVYTEGKARRRKEYIANSRGQLHNVNLSIIIDEGSASASEVLAGAIQDNDRGMIVGRRSFGKGLVQEPVELSDGSGLRLTTARYYTPTGRCIQRPYVGGKEDDYYSEFQRRIDHGELEVADSIKQNDSLRYITPGGRVVYGGGGITPDAFVPLDTVGMNAYYHKVSRKNLVYRFALNFSDKNRVKLHSIKTFAELNSYLNRQGLMGKFSDYAARNGVSGSQAEMRACRALLYAQIRAYIGRTTPLDDEGFYPFLEKIDNALQVAVKTVEKKK